MTGRRNSTSTAEKLPPLDDMYQPWAVSLKFRNGICGGMSPSKSIAREYAELLASGVSNPLKKALKDRGVLSREDITSWMEKNTQVFHMDENGPSVWGYQVASMLYQAGCRGNISGVKTGNPGLALRGSGHILPNTIHFSGNWDVEIQEHPIHIKGSMGETKSALPMFEIATGVELAFEVKLLKNGHLPDDTYKRLWYLAQEEGLGSRRELGHGKFDLLRCEPIKTSSADIQSQIEAEKAELARLEAEAVRAA